jgi:5-methyltetrahydrofolate--homocysteine methyltransferase
MIVISGALNTSRPGLEDLIADRKEFEIRSIIQDQIKWGADYLDLNCGNRFNSEKEDLRWLIEVAQDACNHPLCLDSPDWRVLEYCSQYVDQKDKMILNSSSAESERMERVFSLAKEHDCNVISLLMDESGIPETLEGRMNCMARIDNRVHHLGLSPDRILIDPLVMPVSVSDQAGVLLSNLITSVKKEYPRYRVCGGIDNISFGLPMRSQIKQSAITRSLSLGMDSLLAVLDLETEQTIRVFNLLDGQDSYCEEFLNFYREKIEEQINV